VLLARAKIFGATVRLILSRSVVRASDFAMLAAWKRLAPAVLLGLVVVMACNSSRAGVRAPEPPCGGPTEPAYGPLNQAPARALWSESDLRTVNWTPAGCLGWAGLSRLVAAVAGEFGFAGPIEPLLDRVGAFSRFGQIRYWSVTRGAWSPLVSQAGLAGGMPGRTDLSAADFIPGRAFDYFETGPYGRATYRLTVRERNARRVVIATENTSAIDLFIVPVFAPGALQSVAFLEQGDAGRWRLYQILRAGAGASAQALMSPASYVNRLLALYAHVSGLPSTSDDWKQK
jgi:hypothetical protein